MRVELPDNLGPFLGDDPQRFALEAVMIRLVHEGRATIAALGDELGMRRGEALKWYLGQGFEYPEDFTAEDVPEILRFRFDDDEHA